MSAPTWTPEDLKEFDRLTHRVSSRDQVTRIEAGLDLSAFVTQHGQAKCEAMFAHLTRNEKIMTPSTALAARGIADDHPDLLTEATRLCREVARQERANNTYYRHRQRHVTKQAEYAASLAERCADRIDRLQAIRRETPSAGRWLDATQHTPEVRPGTEREFIVACRRATGKTYVFAAYYLNQKLLLTDADDCPDDGLPFTGWHVERDDDGEYDSCWHPVCNDGDTITHFQPLPGVPT